MHTEQSLPGPALVPAEACRSKLIISHGCLINGDFTDNKPLFQAFPELLEPQLALLRRCILGYAGAAFIGEQLDKDLFKLGVFPVQQFCAAFYLDAAEVCKVLKFTVPVEAYPGVVFYLDKLFRARFMEAVQHFLDRVQGKLGSCCKRDIVHTGPEHKGFGLQFLSADDL